MGSQIRERKAPAGSGGGHNEFGNRQPCGRQAGATGTMEERLYTKYIKVMGLWGDLGELRGCGRFIASFAITISHRKCRENKTEFLLSIASCEKAAEKCGRMVRSHAVIGEYLGEGSGKRAMSAAEVGENVRRLNETESALQKTIKMYERILGSEKKGTAIREAI